MLMKPYDGHLKRKPGVVVCILQLLDSFTCMSVCVSIDGMTMCGCLVDYITQFGMCVPECVHAYACVCARACLCVYMHA